MPAMGILYLLVLVCFVSRVLGRHVSVDVKAPWPRFAGSFAAEVSEFLAEEGDEMFWKYVDAMCGKTEEIERSYGAKESTSSLQTLAFEVAMGILPRSLHSLMNTVIGLNTYAPAVEFFNTIASPYGTPCGDKAFLVSYPGGQVSCSVQEAIERAKNGSNVNADMDLSYYSSDSYEWDHVYTSSSGSDAENDVYDHSAVSSAGSNGGHLILYGAIGSSSFCSLHAEIKSAISNGVAAQYKYSARHSFPGQTPISTSTRLQGYGIFLDIKNMEYKNVDDKKDDDGSDGGSSAEDTTGGDNDELLEVVDGEVIAGVNLAKLSQSRPQLTKEQLSTLKGDLLQAQELAVTRDEEQNNGNVKVWKMKDLGLQTAYSVVTSKVSRVCVCVCVYLAWMQNTNLVCARLVN